MIVDEDSTESTVIHRNRERLIGPLHKWRLDLNNNT